MKTPRRMTIFTSIVFVLEDLTKLRSMFKCSFWKLNTRNAYDRRYIPPLCFSPFFPQQIRSFRNSDRSITRRLESSSGSTWVPWRRSCASGPRPSSGGTSWKTWPCLPRPTVPAETISALSWADLPARTATIRVHLARHVSSLLDYSLFGLWNL